MSGMKTLESVRIIDAAHLLARYRANRRKTTELFLIVRDAMYAQPLDLRHPFIFYLGHIPAFHFNTLAKRAYGIRSFNPVFDDIFRRGIDPDSAHAAREAQSTWPSVDEVHAYAKRVDAIVEDLLIQANQELQTNPLGIRAQAIFTVIEHEEMHQETLIYMIKRLDPKLKRGDVTQTFLGMPSQLTNRRIAVPAGRVTLGARRDTLAFGWDNEFESVEVDVAGFSVDMLPVTNGELLPFVEAGAVQPGDWCKTDDGWMQQTMFGLVPLQSTWPAYVSLDTARAFAASRNARIMSEAEYQRAAFGTPSGEERPLPWGDEAPGPVHGNFGFRRYDPEPIGLSPLGASAWGIHELMGNGWEWTSTDFRALPGFKPMELYPEYSADFFDGKHSVLKGASPVTAMSLLRSSFRNWFRNDYPHAFAKFRLVYDR
jgi:formylglycine-generating enzyme required for sulfatase activity